VVQVITAVFLQGVSFTVVGVVLTDTLRRVVQLIVVHQLAMVLTVLTQASLHSVHYQRRVLIMPHPVRLLQVILRVIRSSSSVRGGVVSSVENLVISRKSVLGC